jgi:hypothetical protein
VFLRGFYVMIDPSQPPDRNKRTAIVGERKGPAEGQIVRRASH